MSNILSNKTARIIDLLIVPLPVLMEDEQVHTTSYPFCSDPSCDCHEDSELMQKEIYQPISDGLLTMVEAVRLYWGMQVA